MTESHSIDSLHTPDGEGHAGPITVNFPDPDYPDIPYPVYRPARGSPYYISPISGRKACLFPPGTPPLKIRIIDNYVRFYLQAIRPAADKIKSGLNVLPANLYGTFGLQFENLVLKNKRLLLAEMGVEPREIVREGPYFQNRTTKHPGCQIDWLIQTRHSLYVVEIKFSRWELTPSVAQEVKQKIKALITPKNLSVRPVLIHVNGVAESVQDADYFDRIVDFGKVSAVARPN